MERAAKERLIGAVVLVSVAWLLIPIFLDDTVDDNSDTVERALTLPNADSQTTAGGAAAPSRRETLQLREPTREAPEPQKVTALPVPSESAPGLSAADVNVSADEKASDPAAILAASKLPSKPIEDTELPNEPKETASAPVSRAQTVPVPKPEPAVIKSSESQQQIEQAPVVKSAERVSSGLWAVQLGSFGNEENAQKLAADLRRQGMLASVSKVEANGNTLHRVRIGPQANRAESEAIVTSLQKKGQVARVVKHP